VDGIEIFLDIRDCEAVDGVYGGGINFSTTGIEVAVFCIANSCCALLPRPAYKNRLK